MTSREHALTWTSIAVILGFVGLWLWQSGHEERSVQALGSAERAALYARTLETLRTTCASEHGTDLGDYCAQQAAFVLRFSECDDGCHELARSRLRPASR